jgi:hypothetical protein
MNSNSNVKIKAVFVFSNNEEEDTYIIVGGHLVVILDDETIIDPSYDIYCLKNKSYFDNIKDIVNIFNNKVELKKKIDIKKLICDHIKFMKISEQINNGELIITKKNITINKQIILKNYIQNILYHYRLTLILHIFSLKTPIYKLKTI